MFTTVHCRPWNEHGSSTQNGVRVTWSKMTGSSARMVRAQTTLRLLDRDGLQRCFDQLTLHENRQVWSPTSPRHNRYARCCAFRGAMVMCSVIPIRRRRGFIVRDQQRPTGTWRASRRQQQKPDPRLRLMWFGIGLPLLPPGWFPAGCLPTADCFARLAMP